MTDETQHCNPAGIALIKKYEGCKPGTYLDLSGIPTIGWGHTGPEVVLGLIWTQEQCDAALAADIETRAEEPINRLVNYELTPNQFSALCSFVYNIGQGNFERSSALICLNAGDFDAVGHAMSLWDKDHAGKVVNGLTARRSEEIALFNAPEPDTEDSA